MASKAVSSQGRRTLIRTSAGHGRQKESVRKLEIIKRCLIILQTRCRGQFHRLTLASGEMWLIRICLRSISPSSIGLENVNLAVEASVRRARNLALVASLVRIRSLTFCGKHRDLAELARGIHGNATSQRSPKRRYDAVCASADLPA